MQLTGMTARSRQTTNRWSDDFVPVSSLLLVLVLISTIQGAVT
jgi:hypothetical protein